MFAIGMVIHPGTGRVTLGLALLSICINGQAASAVEYEVTFNATWSSATHPNAYPDGAHFSPLIGGTHNDEVRIWEDGGFATLGIERMAEQGRTTPLDEEIKAAIADGTAFSLITGGGIGSPASTTTTFQITETHPLVTLVTMIAPSPDWFVGVSGLNLYENGEWAPALTTELYGYDSGTDSGPDFRSANADTQPREPISLLGDPFTNTPSLGTFTFTLVSQMSGAGDYNGSGGVEQGDLDLVLINWGKNAADVPATWVYDPAQDLVDQDELDRVLLNWGSATTLSAGTVPEPSSLLMASAILVCAAAASRW
jgi:hypothetical protein